MLPGINVRRKKLNEAHVVPKDNAFANLSHLHSTLLRKKGPGQISVLRPQDDHITETIRM